MIKKNRIVRLIFLALLLSFILIFINCHSGKVSDQGKGACGNTKEKCSEKCLGEKTHQCCKECCQGNYVWTPEKCECQES